MLAALLDFARSYKAVMALAALSGYLMICLALGCYGLARPPGAPIYLLLGTWVVGVAGLLVVRDRPGRFDAGTLTLAKALWVNLGLVFAASLLPMPVRLMLLFVPLFGVLYTALHLRRRHVRFVAGATWLAYAVASALLALSMDVDLAMEAMLLGFFTFLLVAMVYMAGEVTALRAAFTRRRERLNDALARLSDLAMRDELTGLYNRRYIMEVLSQQKALADRGHVGFALCYCDLDNFKLVNDRFGHAGGDEVLKQFAEIAQSVVRTMDYVARLGGEEFILVLVGADHKEALNVASRLAQRCRDIVLGPDADYDGTMHFSVSTGIASYRVEERLEDVIQRADSALYRAKTGGRDQIVVGP